MVVQIRDQRPEAEQVGVLEAEVPRRIFVAGRLDGLQQRRLESIGDD